MYGSPEVHVIAARRVDWHVLSLNGSPGCQCGISASADIEVEGILARTWGGRYAVLEQQMRSLLEAGD
jgi:hypothetical protein